MQIVHVIPNPKLGDRHEERFPDDFTPEQILAAITQPRNNGKDFPLQYGYGVIKVDPDPEAPGVNYLDHAETRVVIGRVEIVKGKKEFVEVKTIHGPEAKP